MSAPQNDREGEKERQKSTTDTETLGAQVGFAAGEVWM